MQFDIIGGESENERKSGQIINDNVTLERNNNNPIDNNNGNNNNSNNNESLFVAEATFHEEELKIVVNETRFQDQLRNKGFGEAFNNEFVLNSLEALYLLSNNKLKLLGKKDYNFSSFLKILLKKDKKLLTRYLIFRDLRSKGYVVKEGFGFGTDFRIYERGEHGKKPSKYVSIGINEGINIKSQDFVDTIEQIEKMGKDTVIAVIERRGEVIYYKTIKMSFLENKKKS